MQSQWHNCPTINGIQQKNGKKYFASNVSFTSSDHSFGFSADIAGAYPEEAEVKSWVRSIEFDRKLNQIKVKDQYLVNKRIEPMKVHFITPLKTQQNKDVVTFGGRLAMAFHSNLFTVVTDSKAIPENDYLMRDSWGEAVHRVTLVESQSKNTLNGSFVTTFQLN